MNQGSPPAQPKPLAANQRPQTLGVWLLVLSLLMTCFPVPALAATPGTLSLTHEAVAVASCLDDCCQVGSEGDLAAECCQSEDEEDEDPCCPEGCNQCHRPCCTGPLALIAPGGTSLPSLAAGAQPEPEDEVLCSALALGIFHPPRG